MRSPLRRVHAKTIAKLAALALIPIAIVALADDEPDTLAGYELVGARSPVPLDIIVNLDYSGSFSDPPDQRLRADVLRQLWAWAPDELRPDDRIWVVAFAGTAEILVSHLAVGSLDPSRLPSLNVGGLGDDTHLQPVLQQLDGLLDPGRNNTLISVTDTIVSDLVSTSIEAFLQDTNMATVSVLVPDGTRVTASWSESFPYEHVYEVAAADDTAISFGKAIAHATDQRLEPIND